MPQQHEYRFHIDAFTPATIPMARLAEYMAELARFLGEPEHVHFSRLAEGSTILVQTVEELAYPQVAKRLEALQAGDVTADTLRAFASLDRLLAEDNATGTLCTGDGVKVIRFPGRTRAKPVSYGSFRQQGSLDGVLVRIGGTDETAHATLLDGEQTWRCDLTRDMAREMRSHLYEKPLRVHGEGRWRRDPKGKWELRQFRVTHFDVLDDASWPATVAGLRAIGGGAWHDVDDPLGELRDLRDGGEERR